MPGRTSKVVRYYWREIFREATERFAHCIEERGQTYDVHSRMDYADLYESIEREAIEEIKQRHRRSPKYAYSDESQSEVLSKYSVEVLTLHATFKKSEGKGARIVQDGKVYSAEEFVEYYLRRAGQDVLVTESVPFHAVLGVLLWLLIQDPEDPNVRPVMFGDRFAFDRQAKGPTIHTLLPQDFGTSGYGQRRKAAIDEHLSSLATSKENLLWTFDYWIEPSANLRQYLWAHRPESVATARKIVSVLPVGVTLRILRYLVEAYWERYCGWPDLLAYTADKFLFVEVKASRDRLSEEQKRWIADNASILKLPFKLAKIHRDRIGS